MLLSDFAATLWLNGALTFVRSDLNVTRSFNDFTYVSILAGWATLVDFIVTTSVAFFTSFFSEVVW